MRKILYISGTRADYGLMKETLLAIKKHPRLKLEIAACGMHVMPEFGNTINEIRKAGFKVTNLGVIYRCDDKRAMSDFVGELILKLTEKIKNIKPEVILILGDRAEMIAAAIVGAYLGIPVVHIHGGELTSTVDELARHAITKLAHIHMAATRRSAQRIAKMGEENWRIHVVGAPGLDEILREELITPRNIVKKYELDICKPLLIVIQHPVTAEFNEAAKQMGITMEAIKDLKYQAIVIYPNADAGGKSMISVIKKYGRYSFIRLYKSIPRRDYLSLMNVASAILGNSSSGIIESPSFRLPAVNIGTRQDGREAAGNVINVGYNEKAIKEAIQRAIHDKNFISKLKEFKNPYGDGRASGKIANLLDKMKIDKDLLQKRMTY